MSANHPPENPNATEGRSDAARFRHLASLPQSATYGPAYTRLVKRLRIAVPGALLVVLAVIVLWPRIKAELNRPSLVKEEELRARMINTRFVGTDKRARPFTITADNASQPPGTNQPVDMTNPIAEMTLANGRWIAVKADEGRYDPASGAVDLNGRVELFHDEGYRFVTEYAHVEFNKNLVWGDRAIVGHGPKGEIQARGFRVVDNGNTIVFTGPARLELRAKAAQLPEPDAP